MKLIKCYVSSFGKLKDFSCEFNSGLNTIKHENGWGKSTLATFVKSIFYGLNDSKRNVADNERIKYKPWNFTERFGGYIEFEWGGRDFKLERFFGNKESEDTLKLYDLSTGRVHDNPQEIGRRIFEIDEDGFLSTTYFSQKDFHAKSNTSLTAKFNSACEVQSSDLFDKALSKIEEKAKTYKYRGDKGLISDVKREIFDVNEKILESNKAMLTVTSLKNSVSALENDVANIKKDLDFYTEKESQAAKAEADSAMQLRYEKLNVEKNELLIKKQTAEKFLNGNLVTIDEVSAYSICNNELQKIQARKRDLDSDIKELDSVNVLENKKGKSGYFLIAGGALSLIVGIILLFAVGLSFVPSWILAFVGVVFGFLGVFLIFKQMGNEQKNNVRYQEIVQKKKLELNEYGEIESEYSSKISSFINKFNFENKFDNFSALKTIADVVRDYTDIVKRLGSLMAEMDDISKTSTITNNENNLPKLSEIKQIKLNLQRDYDFKMKELANKQASLKYYQDLATCVSDLESQKTALAETLAEYKENYELLNLTADYLKKADENLKVKYRKPLQESLNKYISLIDTKNKSANIDVDFNITIEESGTEKVTDYYSKGYQNLFEICKRFALTDVLFTGEKPFIILDDPFYNLDDDKLKLALNVIKKLSDEYQIIYLVCHDSRVAHV